MIGYNMISNYYGVQKMNYQQDYDDLIRKCKSRSTIDGYKETHHIIPKSMGGHKTDPNNLVDLTAREHFIAHFLLAKIHGGSQWFAIRRMRGNDGFYVNSRLYEVAKIETSKLTSIRFFGIPKSDEQKAKMSASAIGKPKSLESIEKTRKALIGRKVSQNSLEALHAHRHLAWTAEAQEKKSLKTKGVSRPYAKDRTFTKEAQILGGKAGKGRKQTPEQIAKRVASRRATLLSQGRTS